MAEQMTIAAGRTTAGTRRGLVAGAAIFGAAGALLSVATSVLVPLGILDPTDIAVASRGSGFAAWNTVDVASSLMLATGLAGLVRSRAAGNGWLARVGLSAAFLGIGLFTLVSMLTYADPGAGERLHPVSVPLIGAGMLLTGAAVLHTGRWTGWQRFMPMLCGVFPFLVELPGFIFFGDTNTLYYFIGGTWTCWLALNAAVWTRSVDA